jgi:hypothetical protein
MAEQRRILVPVIVVGVALGVVIAGVPSRHKDQPLRAERPAPVTTTTTHHRG